MLYYVEQEFLLSGQRNNGKKNKKLNKGRLLNKAENNLCNFCERTLVLFSFFVYASRLVHIAVSSELWDILGHYALVGFPLFFRILRWINIFAIITRVNDVKTEISLWRHTNERIRRRPEIKSHTKQFIIRKMNEQIWTTFDFEV